MIQQDTDVKGLTEYRHTVEGSVNRSTFKCSEDTDLEFQ